MFAPLYIKNYFINQLIFKFMKKNFKRLAICLAVVAISVASYSVVKAHSYVPESKFAESSTTCKYPKGHYGDGVLCCQDTNHGKCGDCCK